MNSSMSCWSANERRAQPRTKNEGVKGYAGARCAVAAQNVSNASVRTCAIASFLVLGLARLSFADQHDIDEFIAMLETCERGEIGPDQ